MDDALAPLITGLAEAVEPLADAFDSPHQFEAFMAELGWAVEDDVDFTAACSAFGKVPAAVRGIVEEARDIVSAVDSGDRAATAKAVRELIPVVQSVTAAIRAFEAPQSTAGLGVTLASPEFWSRFSLEVFDHLLFRHLERRVPHLYAPLRLLGVLQWKDVPGPQARKRRFVDWDVLVGLAVDPTRTLSDVYRWKAGFDSDAFAVAMLEAGRALGIAVDLMKPTAPAIALFWEDGSGAHGALSVPLYWDLVETHGGFGSAGVALGLVPIPAEGTKSGSVTGLALVPEASLAAGAEIPLGRGATLALFGSLDAAGGIELKLRPTGVTFKFDIAQHGQAQVALRGEPTPEWTPIGRPGATRFEIARAHLSLAFDEARGNRRRSRSRPGSTPRASCSTPPTWTASVARSSAAARSSSTVAARRVVQPDRRHARRTRRRDGRDPSGRAGRGDATRSRSRSTATPSAAGRTRDHRLRLASARAADSPTRASASRPRSARRRRASRARSARWTRGSASGRRRASASRSPAGR